jgi:hypothetical protein
MLTDLFSDVKALIISNNSLIDELWILIANLLTNYVYSQGYLHIVLPAFLVLLSLIYYFKNNLGESKKFLSDLSTTQFIIMLSISISIMLVLLMPVSVTIVKEDIVEKKLNPVENGEIKMPIIMALSYSLTGRYIYGYNCFTMDGNFESFDRLDPEEYYYLNNNDDTSTLNFSTSSGLENQYLMIKLKDDAETENINTASLKNKLGGFYYSNYLYLLNSSHSIYNTFTKKDKAISNFTELTTELQSNVIVDIESNDRIDGMLKNGAQYTSVGNKGGNLLTSINAAIDTIKKKAFNEKALSEDEKDGVKIYGPNYIRLATLELEQTKKGDDGYPDIASSIIEEMSNKIKTDIYENKLDGAEQTISVSDRYFDNLIKSSLNYSKVLKESMTIGYCEFIKDNYDLNDFKNFYASGQLDNGNKEDIKACKTLVTPQISRELNKYFSFAQFNLSSMLYYNYKKTDEGISVEKIEPFEVSAVESATAKLSRANNFKFFIDDIISNNERGGGKSLKDDVQALVNNVAGDNSVTYRLSNEEKSFSSKLEDYYDGSFSYSTYYEADPHEDYPAIISISPLNIDVKGFSVFEPIINNSFNNSEIEFILKEIYKKYFLPLNYQVAAFYGLRDIDSPYYEYLQQGSGQKYSGINIAIGGADGRYLFDVPSNINMSGLSSIKSLMNFDKLVYTKNGNDSNPEYKTGLEALLALNVTLLENKITLYKNLKPSDFKSLTKGINSTQHILYLSAINSYLKLWGSFINENGMLDLSFDGSDSATLYKLRTIIAQTRYLSSINPKSFNNVNQDKNDILYYYESLISYSSFLIDNITAFELVLEGENTVLRKERFYDLIQRFNIDTFDKMKNYFQLIKGNTACSFEDENGKEKIELENNSKEAFFATFLKIEECNKRHLDNLKLSSPTESKINNLFKNISNALYKLEKQGIYKQDNNESEDDLHIYRNSAGFGVLSGLYNPQVSLNRSSSVYSMLDSQKLASVYLSNHDMDYARTASAMYPTVTGYYASAGSAFSSSNTLYHSSAFGDTIADNIVTTYTQKYIDKKSKVHYMNDYYVDFLKNPTFDPLDTAFMNGVWGVAELASLTAGGWGVFAKSKSLYNFTSGVFKSKNMSFSNITGAIKKNPFDFRKWGEQKKQKKILLNLKKLNLQQKQNLAKHPAL